MGNKHAVRNLVPRLGRSRSVTRLSPPNYTDPAGAFEMTALIVPSCRWARRGECKDSLGVKLAGSLFIFFSYQRQSDHRVPSSTNTSQFLPARIAPLSSFHFYFRLSSLTISTSTEIIHGSAMNLRSLSSSLNPIPCCKVVPAGVVEYNISRRKILTVLTPGYKISGTT